MFRFSWIQKESNILSMIQIFDKFFLQIFVQIFSKNFNFFLKSAYMNSNVNCFSDFNLILWFHNWYLNKAIVVFSFRNKCFQFLYMCDTCLDNFLIVFIFSRILKNASSSSFIFISWLCWLVLMSVKSISAVKMFLFEIASSHFMIKFLVCFSFVIERCRCTDWIATTQLHFSNVSILFFSIDCWIVFFQSKHLQNDVVRDYSYDVKN